jgi:hypothetical protein
VRNPFPHAPYARNGPQYQSANLTSGAHYVVLTNLDAGKNFTLAHALVSQDPAGPRLVQSGSSSTTSVQPSSTPATSRAPRSSQTPGSSPSPVSGTSTAVVPTGAIVGGVLGALVLLVLGALLVWLHRRRRRHHRRSGAARFVVFGDDAPPADAAPPMEELDMPPPTYDRVFPDPATGIAGPFVAAGSASSPAAPVRAGVKGPRGTRDASGGPSATLTSGVLTWDGAAPMPAALEDGNSRSDRLKGNGKVPGTAKPPVDTKRRS